MTGCAECGSTIQSETVAVYVPVSGDIAYTLCVGCQTAYPRDRQYSPRTLPKRSQVPIDGGESA